MNTEDESDKRSCPCGFGLSLADCCMPIMAGRAPALSAEALMRSRYTAYVLGDIGYLTISWYPSTRPQQLDLSDHIEWLGLTVLSCKAGTVDDVKGTVEFIARYRHQGVTSQVHENSRFLKEKGVWFYVDGDLKTAVSVGRNDPCTCGSGKKFKKCCGK